MHASTWALDSHVTDSHVICSQPPLLSMMVGAVYEATQDLGFLREAFSALETEYSYWTRPPKAIRIAALDGTVHSLARYCADTASPRPESYRRAIFSAILFFISGQSSLPS